MTAERTQGPAAVPSVEELLASPGAALVVPAGVAADLLLRLAPVVEALRIAACARQPAATPATSRSEAPHMLTLDEAAARAGLERRWLVEHWKRDLPFAVKKGRAVLFPEPELERWLKRR